MIPMPDFDACWDYENNFYLTCQTSRIKKVAAQYELLKTTVEVQGDILESGVFKGCSFLRYTSFMELYNLFPSKKLIGFDAFGPFPSTSWSKGKKEREQFVKATGGESISMEQLKQVLRHKEVDLENIRLVAGNICETVPQYLEENPNLELSLINLDTDIYEPAVTVLETLFPRLSKGGLIVLDNYGVFEGETKAVDDYFNGLPYQIDYLPFCKSPCFVRK